MRITRYSLGVLQTNCYLAVQDTDAVLIDPGDSAEFLLEELQRKHLTLKGIIATHGHFDHVMAVGEIQLSYPVPLFMFTEDSFLLDRLASTAKHFLEYDPHVISPKNIKKLHRGLLTIGELSFEVIHTPGHTPGSCALYVKEDGVVFTGDTLFEDGIGDHSHTYSSFPQLKRSLSHLFMLPEETLVYPGHGNETTIGAEKGRD